MRSSSCCPLPGIRRTVTHYAVVNSSMIAEASARHRRLPTWPPPYSRVIALGKLGKALTIRLHRDVASRQDVFAWDLAAHRTALPNVGRCFHFIHDPPQRMCHCVELDLRPFPWF